MSEERNEAPRPFKVGDFVRNKEHGETGTVTAIAGRNIMVQWSRGTSGMIYWPMADFELLTPAPAQEATAAPGEPLRVQMVPVSLLDEVVKNRDDWKARAEKATADQQAAHAEIANLRKALVALGEMSASDSKEREAVREENAKLRAMLDGEWKADERARFERETAARIVAHAIGERIAAGESWSTEAIARECSLFADHYFPAKERTS